MVLYFFLSFFYRIEPKISGLIDGAAAAMACAANADGGCTRRAVTRSLSTPC
jgi:hypothetical protein